MLKHSTVRYFTLYASTLVHQGRQEHYDIRVEELKVVKLPTGETNYVQWMKGLTKTRKGGLNKPARRIQQKMHLEVLDAQ